MKLSILIRVVIIAVIIGAVIIGRNLFFYNGSYDPPDITVPEYKTDVVPEELSTDFTDVYEQSDGVVLIDLAHGNAYDREELHVLILRLVSRGLTIKFLSEEDDLKTELLGEEELEEDSQEPPVDSQEPPVDSEEPPVDSEEPGEEPVVPGEEEEEEEPPLETIAFIVVSPTLEFLNEEMEAIEEFTETGGKLLLIADPTRPNRMNSLSIKFGLIFEPDYLYNMKENDINYRNIFITDFEDNEIMKNLTRLALYTAGSISSANGSISYTDENTFSSLLETRTELSPIAMARESNVLAIYDLTFFGEPYNGIADNNRFLSNVADWLMYRVEK